MAYCIVSCHPLVVVIVLMVENKQQLAVNVVDVAEPVQKVIGSTKRAHISLCCYGCRVKGGVGGGGGGGKASATGKKKKKKR